MTTTVTSELLKAAFPGNDENYDAWGGLFEPAMQEFGIVTALQKCHFIAQVTHECGDFRELVENLNYSAKGLMKTWPKRFPTWEMANAYARQPRKIANTVYANRMGNGDYDSDDGWRYCGKCPVQITGKDMYIKVANQLGIDIVNHPEILTVPYYQPTDEYGNPAMNGDVPVYVQGPGLRISAWLFAVEKRCLAAADNDNIEMVTRKINGGTIGLEDRKRRLHIMKGFITDFDAAA